jgi:response regulator RpfG family c-di-GMP phosphodiesterase
VALADVYDALICKRAYKDAWEEDRVLHYITEHSGNQFDPEMVAIFFGIYDVIRAIREKWT